MSPLERPASQLVLRMCGVASCSAFPRELLSIGSCPRALALLGYQLFQPICWVAYLCEEQVRRSADLSLARVFSRFAPLWPNPNFLVPMAVLRP